MYTCCMQVASASLESGRERAYRYLRETVLVDPAVQGTFLNEVGLAQAVGVSRRTLFNHVSSKEEAVLGVLPEITDEQVETLSAGGPSGHLIDDLITTILDSLNADSGSPAPKTAEPATKVSAPASAACAIVDSPMPPSTCSHTDEPRVRASSARRRSFGMVSGMKD